jgi:hypothetical protein
VYEVFSVVTNPRIWKRGASAPDQAWAQLEAWMDLDRDFLLFRELDTRDPFA